MDATDEKILELLQGNARMSFQELGDAIGISRVAARKRVLKLEEEGIILGYNTYIKRPGEVSGCLIVFLKQENTEEVTDYLMTQTVGVRQIINSPEGDSLRLMIVTESDEDFDYFVKTIEKRLKDKVVQVMSYKDGVTIKDVYQNLLRR